MPGTTALCQQWSPVSLLPSTLQRLRDLQAPEPHSFLHSTRLQELVLRYQEAEPARFPEAPGQPTETNIKGLQKSCPCAAEHGGTGPPLTSPSPP